MIDPIHIINSRINPKREEWRRQNKEQKRLRKRKENLYELTDAPELLMELSLNGHLSHNNIVGSYIGNPTGYPTKQPFIFVIEIQNHEITDLPENYKGILIKQIPAQTILNENQQPIKEIYNGIYPEPEPQDIIEPIP